MEHSQEVTESRNYLKSLLSPKVAEVADFLLDDYSKFIMWQLKEGHCTGTAPNDMSHAEIRKDFKIYLPVWGRTKKALQIMPRPDRYDGTYKFLDPVSFDRVDDGLIFHYCNSLGIDWDETKGKPLTVGTYVIFAELFDPDNDFSKLEFIFDGFRLRRFDHGSITVKAL